MGDVDVRSRFLMVDLLVDLLEDLLEDLLVDLLDNSLKKVCNTETQNANITEMIYSEHEDRQEGIRANLLLLYNWIRYSVKR